jgi:hypothetical protein
MVELHVDLHPSFQEKMNATTTFGGNLSVRMPPSAEPLIGLGQDERIFKQRLLTSEAWTTHDGQKPVTSKHKGLGGMKLSLEDLKQLNGRRQGKCCSDW